MGTFRVNPQRLIRQAFFAFALFLPVLLFGQDTAELRVEVKDPSGAAVQAAGTLDDHAFQTDSQGQYDFRDLAPGRHRLEVDNILDRHYYTAAQLANTAFTAQGAVQTAPFPAYADGPYAGSSPAQSATFFAPGAPRRAWVVLRAHF